MNLNKVYLIGRLTQDPEIKTTASGQTVCTFGLATNRVWTNQETKQKQEKAEYHNIVLWRRLAEIASQYLNKGSLVLIEGRIQTRSWEDGSGNKRYKTEIVAENIQLGPRTQSSQAASNSSFVQSSKKEVANEEIPVIEEGESIPNQKPQANLASSSFEKKDDEEIRIEDIPF